MGAFRLLGWIVALALAGLPARAASAVISPDDLLLVEALSWGVTPSSAAEFGRLGRAKWLAGQLRPSPEAAVPAPVQALIEATPGAGRPLLSILTEQDERQRAAEAEPDPEVRKAALAAYQSGLTDLNRGAQARAILRALYGPDQLREKMSWFWLNHFNIHSGKAALRAMTGDYLETAIRPRSLGRFRDLLGATLRHPAMLRYLDNAENAAGKLNENYARELLELHTMGVGSGYGQADVEALARILTGAGIWRKTDPPRIRPEFASAAVQDGAFLFNPARHDRGDKVLLGHRIAGGGFEEIEAALDILAREPATARHVGEHLATFFAGDDPPKALVARMAETFLKTDGDIAAVLGAMVASPDFGPARRARHFKAPIEYVLSAVRLAYDEKVILNTQPSQNWLNRLGEGLFNHTTPDGYPLGSAGWTGSGQMTVRFEIARQIGAGPAGLFKPAEGAGERPGFPVLQNELYFTTLRATLSPATRAVLDQATSPQEWNALFLSSPDFMR